MTIHILPNEVIDQIAAGEVVERPAHLVKELVENSLDAGATRIEVEYSQGGRRVRVKDNGSGMGKEELALALSRHATSKISVSDDLWRLSSFGFRGEALASISAVSRLTMTSRVQGAQTASRLISEFGVVSSVEDSGGEKGTEIFIEELFANLPARLKFLKSEAAEGAQIKNVVRAMALSHPEVEFHLTQGGKLVHFWPAAKTPLERAKQILEITDLYQGESEKDGIKVHAVFTDPNNTAKTSKNIWLFAQNRWIQDRSLQMAVLDAFRNLLMHGEFPHAVVWLNAPSEEVDVNIHPTKSQVKLQNPQSAFRAVRNAIKDTLDQAPWLTKVLGGSSSTYMPQAEKPVPQPTSPMSFRFEEPSFERTQFQKREVHSYQAGSLNLEKLRTLSEGREEFGSRARPSVNEFSANVTPQVEQVPPPVHGGSESKSSKWGDLEILGQANLTYIVTQRRDSLVVVDMHAAHERVKFETLMAAWRGGRIEVQDYLLPLSFDFSEEKVEALLRVAPDLERLGLYLESLGPLTIGIKAAPSILSEKAVAIEIEKLASELVEYGESLSLERKIADICATMACHSAVRAGQALSYEQMKALLIEMDQFPLSSFCPHGRPVYVEYPFSKLERDFGRIV